MEKLRRGEKPILCERLAIRDPLVYKNIVANELSTIYEPLVERLILHYDLYAQYRKCSIDRVAELIDLAEQVSVLTLCPSGRLLRQRNWLRMAKKLCNFRNFRHIHLKIRRIWLNTCERHRFFCDSERLKQLYIDWFALVANHEVECHWLLDADDFKCETVYPYSRERAETLLRR